MFKLSEMLNKDVIGLYEAKRVGRISGALFDKDLKRLKYFELTSPDGRAYFAPKEIFGCGKDAVTLKNLSGVIDRYALPPTYTDALIGRAAYTPNGDLIGSIGDVTADGTRVIGITVGESELAPEKLLSVSDDMVIFAEGERFRLVPPKKRTSTPKTAAKPTTETAETVETVMPEQKQTAVQTVDVPVRVSSETRPEDVGRAMGYAFLLGKIVTRTVMGDNGVVVAAEGSVIDEKKLTAAEQAGKLVQLALHSR